MDDRSLFRIESLLLALLRLSLERLGAMDVQSDDLKLELERQLQVAGFSYRDISRATGSSLGALSRRLGDAK